MNTPHIHHDVLARIVALLLGLAMLAERTASRPRAARLCALQILLPAQHAVLDLMDMPADDDDLPSAMDDAGALLHLAVIFRALAALVVHACLTESVPARDAARYAFVRSIAFPIRPARLRFLSWVGLVHDTS